MNLLEINKTLGMNGSVNSVMLEDSTIQFHELISHFCSQIDPKIVYASLGVVICYLIVYNVAPLFKLSYLVVF